MSQISHIYNKGNKVLFRDKEDYIYFINRFGINAFSTGVSTLAITVMSTHFHAIVESTDSNSLNEMFEKIRKSYSLYYNLRYGVSISSQLQISLTPVAIEHLIPELTYVMRNPVHHYVESSPFVYPFSSCLYTFLDNLLPPEYFIKIKCDAEKVESLTKRRIRELFGRNNIPGNWLVESSGMISMSSWINISKARAAWGNNFNRFLYSINNKTKDVSGEVIQSDILDLRSQMLSDLEVCSIIDNTLREKGIKSVHFLDDAGKNAMARMLLLKGVAQEQSARCLWM